MSVKHFNFNNKKLSQRKNVLCGVQKKRIRKVRPWRFLGSEKFIGYLRVGLRKNWFKSCCCLFRVSHVPSVQFGVGELRAPVSSALWHFPTKFVQNLEPQNSMKWLLKKSLNLFNLEVRGHHKSRKSDLILNYCMSKKSWPNFQSSFLYKMGHDFLDIQNLLHVLLVQF